MPPLPPIVEKLLPILKALGIDPEELGELTEAKLKAAFAASLRKTTARLKADGMTPALKAVDEAGERIFIRSALYLAIKNALLTLPMIPFGENVIADYIRDQHDDAVLLAVGPQIDATTKPKPAVVLITNALLERML